MDNKEKSGSLDLKTTCHRLGYVWIDLLFAFVSFRLKKIHLTFVRFFVVAFFLFFKKYKSVTIRFFRKENVLARQRKFTSSVDCDIVARILVQTEHFDFVKRTLVYFLCVRV